MDQKEITGDLAPLINAFAAFVDTQLQRGFVKRWEVEGFNASVLQPTLEKVVETISEKIADKCGEIAEHAHE